ncbi:NERD domain-containing protein [Blastococcus sp. SYSU DS0541]
MSERAVFAALGGLPDSWTVLWDVPVGLFGRPRADLRQIDCLLLHERLGLLVVEVKGGAIKVERGEWSTRPMGSQEWIALQRSPFKQAADQRYNLQRYLSRELRIDPRSFGHAVAFPGCDITADLGPDAPRELAIDAGDLRNPSAALHRVRAHWGDCPPLTGGLIESVVDRLRPSFEMTILSASAAAATAEALERETRRQAQMVENQIEAYRTLLSTDRVVTLGGAGTGKTVVAAQLARQLSSTGSRTLLLCHRGGVQAFLSTLLGIRSTHRSYDGQSPEPLHVAAWIKVAGAVAEAVGRSSVRPADPALSEYFLEFRDALPAPYDALVVDEGQEFTPNQIEALTWLLSDPDSSPVYIFADPFQHSGIFSTPTRDRLEKKVRYKWTSPISSETVMLTTNCRNSSQIAEISSKFYPHTAPLPVADGPDPQFHQVQQTSVLSEAFRLVAKLTNEEGLRPNQLLVVLIGFAMKEAEQAARRSRVSTVALDQIFRFPLTPKDLRVACGRPDDAQGLEADAIVVAYRPDPGTPGTLREMYIATSRARSVLHVVSSLSPDDILASETARTEDADPAVAVGEAE